MIYFLDLAQFSCLFIDMFVYVLIYEMCQKKDGFQGHEFSLVMLSQVDETWVLDIDGCAYCVHMCAYVTCMVNYGQIIWVWK